MCYFKAAQELLVDKSSVLHFPSFQGLVHRFLVQNGEQEPLFLANDCRSSSTLPKSATLLIPVNSVSATLWLGYWWVLLMQCVHTWCEYVFIQIIELDWGEKWAENIGCPFWVVTLQDPTTCIYSLERKINARQSILFSKSPILIQARGLGIS